MVDWTASMQQYFEFYEVDSVGITERTIYYAITHTIDNGYIKGNEIPYPKDKDVKIIDTTEDGLTIYNYTDGEGDASVDVLFCSEKTTGVESATWRDKRKLDNIKSCTITRDYDSDTKVSATFDVTESVGECYIRVYLITVQNGFKERHALGTFLVQTPSSSFDGKVRTVSMDAYSPLLELTEKSPPFGYFIKKGADVMGMAYSLTKDNVRCPVSEPVTPSTTLYYDFIADTDDTYMTMLKDLIGVATTTKCYKVNYSYDFYKVIENNDGSYEKTNDIVAPITVNEVKENLGQFTEYPLYVYTENDQTEYCCKIDSYFITKEEVDYPFGKEVTAINGSDLNNKYFSYVDDEGITNYFTITETGVAQYEFEVDEMGQVTFVPKLDAKYMQPKWTFTDDNSSILDASISVNHDLYGVPNVVEVVYSTKDKNIISVIENNDPNSPTSIINRGRRIIHRAVNPDIHGEATQAVVDKYAEDLLSALSSVEYTISYTHGYCPVKLGDCIMLNYERAGLRNIKAKVIYQNIKCKTGCQVSEKAVFTNKLWR